MTATIVTAGTVLTGTESLTHGAVLVHDRQITAVGPLPEIQQVAEPETELLSYPGTATLMPGLIDAHVRFVFNGGQTPYQDFAALDLSTERLRAHYRDTAMAERARAALDQGVTTVRDIGDSHGLSITLGSRIEDGHLPGPRVVAAGTPLTTPDGDGCFLGGEVVSDADIRTAIASGADAGAQLICYHDSGGFLKLVTGSPPFSWDTQFRPEQIAIIVAEAHNHGLPVAAHVFSKDGIENAVAAGVDTIEHCYWTVGRNQYDRDHSVAIAMAHQGIIACLPTNTNRQHQIDRVGEERAKELWYSRFEWLDRLGVHLAPGSSAGSTSSPFDDFVGCLETYEWLGFTPGGIIHMATAHSAAALGIEKVTGSLRAGYSADLLVVDGNPLTNLQALRKPLLVMAAGRVAPNPSPDLVIDKAALPTTESFASRKNATTNPTPTRRTW